MLILGKLGAVASDVALVLVLVGSNLFTKDGGLAEMDFSKLFAFRFVVVTQFLNLTIVLVQITDNFVT